MWHITLWTVKWSLFMFEALSVCSRNIAYLSVPHWFEVEVFLSIVHRQIRFSAYKFVWVVSLSHISGLNNKFNISIGSGFCSSSTFSPGFPVKGVQIGTASLRFQPMSTSSIISWSFKDWSKSISFQMSMLSNISSSPKPSNSSSLSESANNCP